MPTFNLPYFDQIIADLDAQPDGPVVEAFRRHVHWGYFSSPTTDDHSLDSFLVAAQAMTQRICEVADVADGQRVLDVGCGFGGTIDYLNHRRSPCDLVGVNIDTRQLDRARRLAEPRTQNRVSFIEADACDLPIGSGTFDRALAIECAFHFRSRKQFFRQVLQALRPGGSIALSDFVLAEGAGRPMANWMQAQRDQESAFYGSNTKPLTASGYERMARAIGFEPVLAEDVTLHTLPTYPAMRRLYEEAGLDDGRRATIYLEQLALQGFVRYYLLAFRRPHAS